MVYHVALRGIGDDHGSVVKHVRKNASACVRVRSRRRVVDSCARAAIYATTCYLHPLRLEYLDGEPSTAEVA